MKKTSILSGFVGAIFCLLLTLPTQHLMGQSHKCSFEEHQKEIFKNEELRLEFEKVKKKGREIFKSQSRSTGAYTIPIVFHVVYGNDMAVNISDAQIEAQLARLNAEFAGNSNSTTGTDMEIDFCFAQTRPNGSNVWPSGHAGITRQQDMANTIIPTGGHADLVNQHGFPPDEYLNIFIIEEITGSVLGYSNFSGQLGVVQEYDVTGDEDNPSCGCTLLQDYELGMVLVHEMGHYFGLNHPWGWVTGECLEDDGIADTPPVFQPNFNCPSSVNSCIENPDNNDMVENYMDYTDDICKNAFTDGQKCLAHAQILNNSTISNLVTIENLVITGVASSTGCVDPGLIAIFDLSDQLLCIGETSTLTLINPGTLWDAWSITATNDTDVQSFSGVNQSTNVQVNLDGNLEGAYSITITVESNGGSATVNESNAIYVSNCQDYCNGGVWHFTKYSSVPNFGEIEFTNGIQIGEYIQSNNGNFAGGTYTYSCGSTMFTTDGRTLWNSAGTFSSNAFSLHGCNGTATPNDLQGVIGIENNADEVALFMITDSEVSTSSSCNGDVLYGLSLFLVDPVGAGGVAEPLTPFPGISPNQNYSFADGITTIPHCQGLGHWIIVKGASDLADVNQGPSINAHNQILAYFYDGSTISDPVVSDSGPFQMDPGNRSTWRAYVESSPDGRWIVYSRPGDGVSHIYEFNGLTGQATYRDEIITSSSFSTNTAFSPDGSKLYSFNSTNVLLQYDFDAFKECGTFEDPQEIPISNKSKMQRGPDGKIYLWHRGFSNKNISIINTPNELIEDGNTSVINLLSDPLSFIISGTHPYFGIPNYIESSSSTGIDIYCCIEDCNDVSFFAEGCTGTFTWDLDNGDTGTGNTISTSYADGAYQITLTGDNGMTVTKDIEIGFQDTPVITPEDNICDDPSVTYNVSLQGYIYEWSVPSGGTLTSVPNLNIAEVLWDDPLVGGQVCVEIFDEESGCKTSVCFQQPPCNSCDLIITTEVTPDCDNDGTIIVAVANGSGNYKYVWTPGSLPDEPNQSNLSAGDYTVTVIDNDNPSCSVEVTINVPLDPGCSSCSDIETINAIFSPTPFCYESDADFSYYYINLHVPNWGGTQSLDFEFCGLDYEFSIGELIDPFVQDLGWAFEIEGFLKIPNANVNDEICVTIPICIDGVEKCGEFCFTLEEDCPEECDLDIDASVTLTFIGTNNPPCGIPGYDLYNVDFDFAINLPPSMVGHYINVQIYSDVGQLCTPAFIDYPNATDPVIVIHNSVWNSNNSKHFCFHVHIKDKTTGINCDEYYCVPLDQSGVIDITGSGSGSDEGEGDGKGGGKDGFGMNYPDQQSHSTKLFSVRPTITSDVLNVVGVADDTWSFEVYSVGGQLMKSGSLINSKIQNLNVETLNNGMYLLRLKNEQIGYSQVERFVKF